MINPKAALDAFTACGETVGAVTLSEITLGKAAVLERIGSPLFARPPERAAGEGGDAGDGPAEAPASDTAALLLPTLFVLAHPSAAARRLLADGGFESAVDDWADAIPLRDGPALAAAFARIAGRLSAVMPSGEEGGAGKKDPAATAGSQPSPQPPR